MKRFLCLIFSLLLLLSGCALSKLREPVAFYYPRAQYHYGSADGVIVRELREGSGHMEDFSYLLSLYLMGPENEELTAPLPQDVQLLETATKRNGIYLTLSDTSQLLTESEFSLACACLALTAIEITGQEAVTIESGDRSITMTAADLTLYDDSAAIAATEETQ